MVLFKNKVKAFMGGGITLGGDQNPLHDGRATSGVSKDFEEV